MAETETGLRLRLYKLLLDKYSSLINEKETKTVGEIKALVNSEDLTIQGIASAHRPENYEFGAHYLQAAESAYNFICGEISYIPSELGLDIWLAPKEILSAKIADDSDLAVLLCSVLYALGDEKAEVVVAELENANTHAFAITEFEGKFILLDPAQKRPFMEFSGEKEKVLGQYSFNGAKIRHFLYKFNAQNYEQFV
ncbi:MAG: hypothetical protein J4415_02980 [Candidatus Diapherotrites archaeon]|uniref:Transglutaminase-like domain-containing protein n=1 Tax=Candidatus Iainarchaeum sp. TaxID=3101447 RepID=A0A8T4KXU7_9ARCH|nr:hypothetical protein [Candidatus Diapherotrites archaeon]